MDVVVECLRKTNELTPLTKRIHKPESITERGWFGLHGVASLRAAQVVFRMTAA